MMPMPWPSCSPRTRSRMAGYSATTRDGKPFGSFSAGRVSASALPSTILSVPSLRSTGTRPRGPGTSCRRVPMLRGTRRCGGPRRIMTAMSGSRGSGNFSTCGLCRISGHHLRRAGRASLSYSSADGARRSERGTAAAGTPGARCANGRFCEITTRLRRCRRDPLVGQIRHGSRRGSWWWPGR